MKGPLVADREAIAPETKYGYGSPSHINAFAISVAEKISRTFIGHRFSVVPR